MWCTCSASALLTLMMRRSSQAEAADVQVVTVAVLGHKAELCFMALHTDMWLLRDFQTALTGAGIEVVDSFVSITELSEYA